MVGYSRESSAPKLQVSNHKLQITVLFLIIAVNVIESSQ